MEWTDQNPPANDVLLSGYLLIRGSKVCFSVDRLQGEYRATIGDLFGSREIGRHSNLDSLLVLVRKFCD